MTAIGRACSSILPTALRMTAPLRRLQVDLKEIGEILTNTSLQDGWTQGLRDWHNDFLQDLHSGSDLGAVEQKFIEKAQRMSVDPISQVPLDEEALLGSDGRVYSRKSLILHFYKNPPENIFRSPIEPSSSDPFATAPHLPARRLVEWLKNRQALIPSESFEQAYSQVERPLLPPVREKEREKEPVEEPQSEQIESSQALQDIVERRRLRADLLQIGEFLAASPLQDEITERLRRWQENFSKALHLKLNQPRIEEVFLSLLQKTLIDSISQAPLDEEAFLGSDGRLYGSMSLALYLRSVPEEYRHRSPLDLQNPAPFTVSPHLPARYLVQWLKKRGDLRHSEPVEQAYKNLADQKLVPALPTERNERIRRLKERQAERDRTTLAEKEIFSRQIEYLRRDLAQVVHEGFTDIHQRTDEIAQRQLQQVAAAQQKNQAELEPLKQAIALSKAKTLDLAMRTQTLQSRLDSLGEAITKTEREDIKLQIAINETREEIRKANEKRGMDLFGTLLCIAGCAFGSWALQSVLTSMGASVGASMAPIQNGIKFSLSIKGI